MRNPKCVNLRRRFGDRYRIEFEDAYYAIAGERTKADKVWYQVIPCKWGTIYPYGDDILAAEVDGHPRIANRLRDQPFCRVHQDGDFGELTVLFHVNDIRKVAKIMRARRKRQISDEERAVLMERLKLARKAAERIGTASSNGT